MTLQLVWLLSGCGSLAVSPDNAALPWQDAAFDYRPDRVSVQRREQLLALDPALADTLREARDASFDTQDRVDHLVERLFGPQTRPFAYAGSHSTIAAETWRNQRGDCLSLTLLAYAMARALGLPAQMQEVRVAAIFDRRDGLEFVNRHVNLVIRNQQLLRLVNGLSTTGSLVIDFEPQIGSRRAGAALSEAGMLARYYNNVAVEALAQGEPPRAYAHFKAAIQTDPGFAPSYANLAQLYLRRGFGPDAERLLRRAIELRDDSNVATHTLRQLLLAQGRSDEAALVQQQLRARQVQDPHYWLGRGLEALSAARTDTTAAAAIQALERAQALANGFEEIHHYLAIAYWRAGRQQQAEQQLRLLVGLSQHSPSTAALGHKIAAPPLRDIPAR